MENYLFDLGISVVLSAIRAAIKDPERAAALKRALLKVRTQIDRLYGDPLQAVFEQKQSALDRLTEGLVSARDEQVIDQKQYAEILRRAS